ncbi:MAG: FecR domain-containing protein [Rhodospirillales bacterium]|nr:MAG: FecR domain-containing protein [Rhodospirillales bacterium]
MRFSHIAAICGGALLGIAAFAAAAVAQGGPPSQAGRLAFIEGTVSFHDEERTQWTRAVVNTPLTSGDSLWTEPGARAELSLAGTRLRMEGGTQLDVLQLDDGRTRLQLAQGRVDIRAFTMDTARPYEIVTPRGTITLTREGDYYIEAGSIDHATRLGVRSGAGRIDGLEGQTLVVAAGEVGELYGVAGAAQLRTVRTAPPPAPAYWAARDRQIAYGQPSPYLPPNVVGYEDMNAYGGWSDEGEYGRVWTPRAVPAGWAPYRNGHWTYVRPWGWTWVDEQPWGFAPFHYGRWANVRGRWVWVPPRRDVAPVYAPALVAFIGAALLGDSGRAPVGWFPLGAREVYVPSYTTDRTYFRNINRSSVNDDAVIDGRYQRAQRRDAPGADDRATTYSNRRFTTVVPAEDFTRSRPVARAALTVAPEKLAAAPVAPVAAPPAPVQPAATTPPATGPDGRPRPVAEPPRATTPTTGAPVTNTPAGAMPTIGRPAATDRPVAPGPKLVTRPNAPPAPAAGAPQGKPVPPPLLPRTGAPPPPLTDDKTPTPIARPEPKAPAGAPPPRVSAPTTAPPAGRPAEPGAPPAQVPAARTAPAPTPPAVTKPEPPPKANAPAPAQPPAQAPARTETAPKAAQPPATAKPEATPKPAVVAPTTRAPAPPPAADDKETPPSAAGPAPRGQQKKND